MARDLVVAIDGPSGSGKSTAGKALARRLGFRYADSGAMYRAVAVKAKRSGIPFTDGEALSRMCETTLVSFAMKDGKNRVYLDGEDVTTMAVDEKARKGMFLAFQYPVAIPGVSVANFLRASVNARRGTDVPIREFRKEMNEAFKLLEADVSKFASRSLNDGFSGGEKKRIEILQMAMLKPRVARGLRR